jgi:preprotein translocase subunit YajC
MSVLPLGVSFAAQQPAAAPGPDMGFFLMMGVVFAIFYFLVIRPQSKQKRELEQAVKAAAKGDQVVTSGGLHGKIVSSDDATFTIEIATLKGAPVRVQVSRAKVESVSSKAASSSKTASSAKTASSSKSDSSADSESSQKDSKGSKKGES